MHDILSVVHRGSRQIEKLEDDLLIERDSSGHYADTSNQEETEILAELQASPWREVVAKRFAVNRPWLHSIITDGSRSAFIDRLPLKKGGTFLDVGSGWGQVAIPLSKYGDVFCLDLTLARLNILREIARQERVTLGYVCGNFMTFPFEKEQFDCVVFNGSLEYITVGIEDVSMHETQLTALRKACTVLRRGGILYIGIENSLGLKYLLGAPDDHTGIPHLMYRSEAEAKRLFQLKNSAGSLTVKTWSLKEYRKLLADAGFEISQIYGCFPDYKIIRSMIPLDEINQTLAEIGMPFPEHSGVDGTLLPGNEHLPSLYRLLAINGVADKFCPSYAFIGRRPA